jgi:hypothetical protein
MKKSQATNDPPGRAGAKSSTSVNRRRESTSIERPALTTTRVCNDQQILIANCQQGAGKRSAPISPESGQTSALVHIGGKSQK